MIELISVHVPKCAGLSLKEALLQAYGKRYVYLDYEDSPFNPNSPIYQDPQGHVQRFQETRQELFQRAKVTHGHFHISKYSCIENAVRITLLREPVDRLLSHYFFWKTHPSMAHPLHAQFVEQHMSLLDFAAMPMVRGFYSDVFFKDVDMRIFDFVGRYERMEESLAKIQKLTGKELAVGHVNASTFERYQDEKNTVVSDRALMTALNDLLKRDITFYERWSKV